jgi:hypothetical protein
MGAPDSDVDSQHIVALKDGEEIWIYHWRGWHDWLYFIIENKKVKRADWWYAYE